MALQFQKFFELVQVMFILFFTVYLFDCVDYDMLFGKTTPGDKENPRTKVTLSDVFGAPGQCMTKMSPMVMISFTKSLCFFNFLFTFRLGFS